MENNKPKFNIGDKVFVIDNNKLEKKIVFGIYTLFESEPGYSSKKPPKFKGFKYFFEIADSNKGYSWFDEKDVFRTKEELIASL